MIILLTVSIQCSDHCCFFTISAQCSDDQFECHNHDCKPLINRCDGTPQCSDKSDEFRCGMFISEMFLFCEIFLSADFYRLCKLDIF
jgi:hypothetical protein